MGWTVASLKHGNRRESPKVYLYKFTHSSRILVPISSWPKLWKYPDHPLDWHGSIGRRISLQSKEKRSIKMLRKCLLFASRGNLCCSLLLITWGLSWLWTPVSTLSIHHFFLRACWVSKSQLMNSPWAQVMMTHCVIEKYTFFREEKKSSCLVWAERNIVDANLKYWNKWLFSWLLTINH